MNGETTDTTSGLMSGATTTSSTSGGLNGNGVVHRVAQKAHEAVNKLEQTVSSSSDRMTGWQEEYGGQMREQIKANPLTAVGIAFAAGILFNRILGR